jgi:hypothetical protein
MRVYKIRNKIRQRNRIHYKAKTTNNPDHWKQFREIRNEVIDLVRKTKDEYKNKPPGLFIFKIFNWSKTSCSVIINSFN